MDDQAPRCWRCGRAGLAVGVATMLDGIPTLYSRIVCCVDVMACWERMRSQMVGKRVTRP